MNPFLYWLAYWFLKILSFFFYPLKVVGRENIPRGTHFIYASNHISYLDPILLGLSVRFRISYMAKDDLFKNKIFGWILWNFSSAFPLKRETGDVKAIKEAIRRLKSDSSVVIFPQGTRMIDPATLTEDKAQEGIGFLAVRAGVPVVPAKIMGSEKVLPPEAKFPRRHLVTIVIGKPLHAAPEETYAQFARRIMRHILSL